MPTYKVTDPQTGRTVRLTGDSPPTEQELNDVFSKINSPKAQSSRLAKITGFLLPSATKVAEDVGRTISSRIQLGSDTKLRQSEDDFATKLLKRAQQEKDPEKRQQYLNNYRGYINEVAGYQQERIRPDEMSDEVNTSIPGRAAAFAGEIGSLFTPGGAAGTATAKQRVASAAIQGAESGLIRGGTKVQKDEADLVKRAKDTVVDTLVGGATAVVLQGGMEAFGKAREGINAARKGSKEKGIEIYANTFKEDKGNIRRLIQKGGDPQGKGVAERALVSEGIPNSKAGVIKEFERYKPEFEKGMDEALKAASVENTPLDKFVQESGGRPLHQKLLEWSANNKDYATVGKVLDSIPADDPYKATMEKLFRDKVPATYQTARVPDDVLGYLEGQKKVIDVRQMIAGIKEDIDPILNRPETRAEYTQAIDYLDDAAKEYGVMTPLEANKLRKSLDKITGEKLLGDAKGKEKAIKILSGALRSEVKESVPETRLLADRYSLLATLSEAMKKDPGFLDLPSVAAGLGGGAISGGGGIPVAYLIALGIRRPTTKRAAASLLYAFGKNAAEKVPQVGMTPGIPFFSSFMASQNDAQQNQPTQ